MKKTQSLKLMLLGLLASVSSSAWAQYTQQKGVVYGLNADGKAIVVGVLQTIPDGTWGGEKKIEIADEVTIDGVTAKVVDFAADWKTPKALANNETGSIPEGEWTTVENADGTSTVTYKENGGTVSTVVYPATDATKLGTVDFVLTGTELTEITKDDIVGLPIAAFVLGKNSGVVNIPDGLLAAATSIEVLNEAKQPAIDAANDKLNGTTSYIIKDGLYKGHKVYRMVRDDAGNSISQERYFYVDESRNIPGGTDGNFLHPAFRFSTDGKFTPGTEPYYWVDERSATKNAFVTFDGTWKEVGTLVPENTNLGAGHVPGSIENYNDAKLLQEAAQEAYDNAETAYGDALSARGHKDDINAQLAANRKLADDLYNAIMAFDAEPYKSRAASVLETNVNDLTAWTIAYTYATYRDNNGQSLVQDQTQRAAVNTFVAAYQAFNKKDPQAIEGVTITGYEVTPYLLKGELTQAERYLGTFERSPEAAKLEAITGISTILAKDSKNDTDIENQSMRNYEDEHYYKLTVLTSDGEDAVLAGSNFYIKKDPETIDLDGNVYYALYRATIDGDRIYPKLVTQGSYDYPLVVKFTGTQDFDLVPSADNLNMMDWCDPYNDVIAVQNANKPKTDDDLNKDVADAKDALDKADEALDKANDALDKAEKQKKADEKALEEANKMPNYVNEYTYNPNGKNETLVLGAFNNDVVTVGEHAFANCIRAKFTGTFKNNLVKIGAEAFLNTLFANLNLSKTGLTDWRGDADQDGKWDVDEDGNLIPDGVFDINDRLNDNDIAQDAFSGTPLEKMLLSTTNLSDDAIKFIVKRIKRESIQVADECDATEFYTRENVNKTLVKVTLPAGDENLACEKVLAHTFEDCIELPAITFPAQIDAIEEYAFAGCDKLATITFANTDSELLWIGNYAFAATAAATIDLSAQKKLGENVGGQIGDYAFAYMKNLDNVNFTNTKLTTLPGHIFAGDTKLTTVTFFDATDPKSESTITTLGAGLFADSPIEVLDISKTKLTVLNKLFAGGPQVIPTKIECNGVITDGWADPHNTTLKEIKLPATLQTIKRHALAYMWNKDFTTVEIPGNVSELEEGVFGDDRYLETVSFFNYQNLPAKKDFQEGSNLTCLPPNTFNSTPVLKNVYLVTYETLDNDCFGDNLFHSSGTQNEGATAQEKRVNVYVTYDSYMTLTAAPASYPSTYSNLQAFQPQIKGGLIDGIYYKPFTSKMGAWIEAIDEGPNATGVYTAYQNGNSIILYPAKKNDYMGKSYYKIAAYDDDAAMAALQSMNGSTQPILIDPTTGVIYVEPDGDMFAYVLPPFQGDDDLVRVDIFADDLGYWYWNPFTIDDVKERIIENNYQFVYIGSGSNVIPSQIKQLLEERLSFGSFGSWGNFNPPTDILAKTWMALGVAIVASAQPSVTYLQMTNPDHKYQSTLDLANQLSVAHYDIPKALNEGHYYYLAKNSETDKPYFRAHDDESLFDVVPKGSVVFQTTGKQGQGAREFFDVVIVSESEATGINSVTEYISAKDADAIYNLQGVKVAAPQKGQLYIQNGKKFIQK